MFGHRWVISCTSGANGNRLARINLYTNHHLYLTIKSFTVPVIHCNCFFFLHIFIDCAVKTYKKKVNSICTVLSLASWKSDVAVKNIRYAQETTLKLTFWYKRQVTHWTHYISNAHISANCFYKYRHADTLHDGFQEQTRCGNLSIVMVLGVTESVSSTKTFSFS